MKRKKHWLLFAILLLALINLSPSDRHHLFGTNATVESEPEVQQQDQEVQQKGKIRIAVKLSGFDWLQLQRINRQFMDTHPVDVELINIPSNEDYSYMKQLIRQGESPDIMLLDNVWVRNFAAEGYLIPTENYLNSTLPSEMLSASLTQNEWNGYVWGVPSDIDPYVWVYNPSAFSASFGVGFPKSANEWSELAHRFNQLDQGRRPSDFAAFDFADPYAAVSFLWQLNDNYSIDQIRPYLVNLSTDSDPDTIRSIWGKLREGKIAAALVKYSDASNNLDSRLDIHTVGSEYGAGEMWIAGRSYTVSSLTEYREAAGLWISMITSFDQQRQWYELTDYLPALKNVYEQVSRAQIPFHDGLPNVFADSTSSIPVSAALPKQMERFSETCKLYFEGTISLDSYLIEMNELKLIGP